LWADSNVLINITAVEAIDTESCYILVDFVVGQCSPSQGCRNDEERLKKHDDEERMTFCLIEKQRLQKVELAVLLYIFPGHFQLPI
jgi:hypothetical protein